MRLSQKHRIEGESLFGKDDVLTKLNIFHY